jgi:hypothetical protein
MFHLRQHPEIAMGTDERCEMGANQHVPLIRNYLYPMKPAVSSTALHEGAGGFRRGIKCPSDLENVQLAIPNYNQYFPRTKFIVGLRHPVLWFESFYNFRVHNEFPMPPPQELIGRCGRRTFNVCTFRANFHLWLANAFMYTRAHVDPQEQQYFSPKIRKAMRNTTAFDVQTHRRPLFLYEIRQLNDTNTTRDQLFRQELQSFLGIQQSIPPWIRFKPGRNRTAINEAKAQKGTETKRNERRGNAAKISICDTQYDGLRQALMISANNASHWIRDYFLHAPGVIVSSPDYFAQLLRDWEHDPCTRIGLMQAK